MSPAERAELLARYRAGFAAVEAAVAGLDDAALDRRPADGGWSARMVVHHLADSEMTAAIRLRRLLTEDEPVIGGYDENVFAQRLFYDRPIDAALEAARWARATSLELLERLDEAAWARGGTHAESGPYGVEIWLRTYAEHPEGHAAQIAATQIPAT